MLTEPLRRLGVWPPLVHFLHGPQFAQGHRLVLVPLYCPFCRDNDARCTVSDSFFLLIWRRIYCSECMIINPHFVYSSVLKDQYHSGEQGSMPPQQLMLGQNGPLIGRLL